MAVEINEVIVIDNDKNVNVGVITATSYSGENINLTGVVTAIDANFSGNVSVGGTLTYEDVTNIDSVGLITARSGIKVLAGGIDVTGVTTASSFVGDGSQLTNLPASGGTLEATASGTLSDGSTVLLNVDGTVSVVAQSANPQELGSPVIFESASTEHFAATFDPSNNKVVIAYQDEGNSSAGTAVVGTVSGTSINFGTPVVFESGGAGVQFPKISFDSNKNTVVIIYAGNNLSNNTKFFNFTRCTQPYGHFKTDCCNVYGFVNTHRHTAVTPCGVFQLNITETAPI